jgi:hypothetical protein
MVDMKEIITAQTGEMRKRIKQYAGPEVCIKVLAGSEKAVEFTNPVDYALWMKEAVDRLNALTDERARKQIMIACGRSCNTANHKETEEARERRSKYETEEEFLEDELNPPPGTGVRFERDGDVIYNYYTPRRYGDKSLRCYCFPTSTLPEGVNISPTYCQCSRAFVQKHWEDVLGRPVRVELGKTALSTGSDECQFIVHLK